MLIKVRRLDNISKTPKSKNWLLRNGKFTQLSVPKLRNATEKVALPAREDKHTIAGAYISSKAQLIAG